VTAADELGAHAGQLSLLPAGIALEKGFSHYKAEDGVAEKLEALIVGPLAFICFAVYLHGHLVGLGAVGKGVEQQFRALEAVPESPLEWGDVRELG
jgi:hypothetical protein